jgi:hypothetical protein
MDSLGGIAVELCCGGVLSLCASGESEQRYVPCPALRLDQDASHRRYVLACTLVACDRVSFPSEFGSFLKRGLS